MRGLRLHFTGPPCADVTVTYCNQKKEGRGGGVGLEIVTWEADGSILQAPPLCRFSLHVLADLVDKPRDAADVSMMAC